MTLLAMVRAMVRVVTPVMAAAMVPVKARMKPLLIVSRNAGDAWHWRRCQAACGLRRHDEWRLG